jgi:hypothetical protein
MAVLKKGLDRDGKLFLTSGTLPKTFTRLEKTLSGEFASNVLTFGVIL